MEPLDLAVLALRIGLVLLLYAFLFVVLRASRAELQDATATPPAPPASRSAAAAAPARLELLVLDPGESDLEPGQALGVADRGVLGRGGRSSVVLRDPTVSTEHAVVRRSERAWNVADLHSTNGTWVNERAVSGEVPLEAGDVLRVGNVRLKVALRA